MFPPSHSNVKGRHYFSIFMVTRLTIYKCQNDNTIVMDSAYYRPADSQTDQPMDGPAYPLIEMHGRI